MSTTRPVLCASSLKLGYLAGAIFPTIIARNCLPPRPLLRTNVLFPIAVKTSQPIGDFNLMLFFLAAAAFTVLSKGSAQAFCVYLCVVSFRLLTDLASRLQATIHV